MADHELQNANNTNLQLNELQLESSFKELKTLIGEQESRIQNLQNSAFQLANYYFVFQGVVLAAVSNTTSLTCSDAWYIFTLSLIAATLNLCALFSIASKYIRAMNLHDLTWCHYNSLFHSTNLVSTRVHQNRAELDFTRSFSPDQNNNNVIGSEQLGGRRLWIDKFSQVRRHVVLGACMVLFLGFTGVTLAGPWQVTCTHDHHRKRPYGTDMDDCLSFARAPDAWFSATIQNN